MSNKILIVEDEPLIAEDLAMMLSKEGYHIVGVAHDGGTALDILHSQTVDLALLDIALDTSMSGFDVAQVINDKYRIPIVFITSFSDKYTLDRAKEVDPAGYIVKPFKKKDVIANVALAIHKRPKVEASIYLPFADVNAMLPRDISAKEYELLVDIAKGMTNQDLCDKYFISLNTVKTHLKRIFVKMNVKSRNQAAALILRH